MKVRNLLLLQDEIKNYFSSNSKGFDQIMALEGEVYRSLPGRQTKRIIRDGHIYFIKQHTGVGWKEIFKNIFQLRLPIVSAKKEWKAIKQLKKLNIAAPDIVGYGCRGINPATLQSFIMTREIANHTSLEELGKHWKQHSPLFLDKIKIIKEVARIARILHVNGINHRDFYICHFLLDLSVPINIGPKLYLIDLHRAGLRKKTPMRWILKDLAGLYFSSKEVGLTQRDLLRFMKEYSNKSLRDVIKENVFWKKVMERGDQLYRKYE